MLSQTQVASQSVQESIYKRLQEFHKVPDYNNYLIYIFTRLEHSATNDPIRVSAGIQLKNNISQYYQKFHDPVKVYVQSQVLSCLGDPSEGVRSIAGGIISAVITRSSLDHWPGLLENLVGALKNPDTPPQFIDGILSALSKICEDSAHEMCQTAVEGGPAKYEAALQVIIPLLLQYVKHDVSLFRRYALTSLNHFIPYMPHALWENFNELLNVVMFAATDPSHQLKGQVCKSFVQLALIQLDLILPYFAQIVPVMLHFTKDEDGEVALEACEFWALLCYQTSLREPLRPFLPSLVPVLLESMVYSETDQYLLAAAMEDTSVPDQSQDIEPGQFKSRNNQQDDDDDEDDDFEDLDDDEDDEDEEEDDGYSEWNLRKCAAASLDKLANLYQGELLQILIPVLQSRMLDGAHWSITECNILTLGAIAKGCFSAMIEYLPALVPYLIKQMENPQPLVRIIACWSISRYGPWIAQQDRNLYLVPLLQCLLTEMVSQNKKVQQAASTAMTSLQEKTRVSLLDFFEPVVTTLHKALIMYQAKNRLILFDVIGIYAVASLRNSDNDAAKQKFAELLMPLLLKQWDEFHDDDRGMCNLAECFIDLFESLGPVIKPFASSVFTRCLQVIETVLVLFATDQANNSDADFIIAGLNLMSVMVESLGADSRTFVTGNNTLGLLYRCMREGSRIRRESFALLGDVTPYCMPEVAELLKFYMPEILEAMVPGRDAGNAAWALGLIIRHANEQDLMPTWTEKIMGTLNWTMSSDSLPKELRENAAIALGWMALRFPTVVAPHLGNLFGDWCFSLKDVPEEEDKIYTYFGICAVIEANPQAIFNQNLLYLINSICSWQKPPPELAQKFHLILHEFKKLAPPQEWDSLLANLDAPTRQQLAANYKI